MSELSEVKVSEVVEIIGGGTPKTTNPEFWDGDIPWLSIEDFNNDNRFVSKAVKTITDKGLANSSTKILNKGDLIISARGTVGKLAQLEKPMAFNQSCYGLRGNSRTVSNDYLYYALKTRISSLLNAAHGAVFNTITRDTFDIISIPLPSLDEQRQIALTLGALDQKIELNRHINETLEAMARALFKSWFVDFAPVRAKLEGRKPEGMDAATATLFPAAFNDGGIPEGWEEGTLEKISDLNSESWSNANHPDDVEYVDLANTKWGTIENTQAYRWKEAPSRARRVLRQGDTIIGTVRPGNGSYSFVGMDGLTGSTGFAVLRPKKPIYREVVYLAATAKDNIERLTHLADGGAYPAVRPDIVLATSFIYPDEKILSAFSQQTAALFDRIEANKRENQIIAELRDTLLPKLISGELRIQNVQAHVKEAV